VALSDGNIAFTVKHVYPEDPIVDYFYKSRLQTQGFGPPDATGELPTPRIRYTHPEICLLTDCEGMKDEQGKIINYDTSGLPEALTKNTAPWVDMKRGVVQARASWDKDAGEHQYDWVMKLSDDIVLWKGDSAAGTRVFERINREMPQRGYST
jgi:hypothetical protein